MEFNKFEEKLREDWYDATEEVDVNALISSIHPLDNNKKRVGFYWILGLCLCLGALGIHATMKSDALTDINKTSAPQSIAVNNTNQIIKENNEVILPSNISDNEVINPNNTTTNSPNKISKNIKTQSTKIKRNSNSNFVSNVEKTTQYISTNKTGLNNNKISKEKADDLLNVLKSSHFKNSTSNSKEGISKNLNTLKVSSFNDKKLAKIEPFLAFDDDFNLFTKKIKCPSFTSPKWSISVGLEGGVFSPIKQLELLNTDQEEMYQIRDNNEKTLEGIQASAYVQVNSERLPIYFKVGGTFSKITESLNLTTTTMEKDTTFGIISITQSQTGDTLTVIYGNVISDVTVERNTLAHHYFNLVDIPISVGFDIDLGKKLYLGFEAGANINILAKAKGKLLKDSESFEQVETLNAFQRTVGLNYFGGLLLGLNLNDSHAIYLHSKFNYNPHNFGTSTNYIGQKYNFAGVNLGYKYSF